MPITKQPNAEPIPGYRLVARLGGGGFGEVWKCVAPGGLFKAIKFVFGNLNGVEGAATQAHEELRAIQHIKDIRHPFLLSIDRVESANGELMIVTELAEKSLHDVFVSYQHKGLPGIPRDELLGFLVEAAEVLDLMNVRQGLQHLDVKPHNLFVVGYHVKVADFGLVTSLSGQDGIKLGAVTPLYASPEVFQGKATRSSDQYSLACTYVELLTGKLPFHGKNTRQLFMQHIQEEPDLSALPETDRAKVLRALDKDPGKRHSSCLEFIRLLQGRRLESIAEMDLDAALGPTPNLVDTPVREFPVRPTPRSEAQTQTLSSMKLGDTDSHRAVKGPPSIPNALAGYRFSENLGSSLLADVWKATAPDGRLRLVKYIYGFGGQADEAARRLMGLHHPALPHMEVVQIQPGCLVLVNDDARETVRDRWQKCQGQKLPGIPRGELLGYLRTVAEVVDYLYQQHSIHHLGLNPRIFLLADGGLQVADFGLAHLFWMPSAQPVAQRNARYAAPELFDRQLHRGGDQFSLAIIYQELLTGTHPFGGRSRGAPGGARSVAKPNLDPLPKQDQAAIARALAANPELRWPSCLDLVRALEGNADTCSSSSLSSPSPSPSLSPPRRVDVLNEIITSNQQPPVPPGCQTDSAELRRILSDIIARANDLTVAPDTHIAPCLLGSQNELRHTFRVGMPVGTARIKVDAFRKQCQGQLVRENEQGYGFRVAVATSFWRKWFRRPSGIDVHVEFRRVHAQAATPINVTVKVSLIGRGKKRAAAILQGKGKELLEGLQANLCVHAEKRPNDRLLWPRPVQISPVDEDGNMGDPIQCRGKDISLTGMAFYLPHELPTSLVVIRLQESEDAQPTTIAATLVRAHRCADGWYDVGVLFRVAAVVSASERSVCGS